MGLKFKPILLKCDFIGFIPQFRILNETRYKSIFSSILSILIILFSIVFVSYSFVDYAHQNPKVEYYKNSDYETNKTYTISNSLLMFKYTFICLDDLSFDHTINIYSEDLINIELTDLRIEPCELGKNIDSKYKEVIENFEKVEKRKLGDYFCIDYNNTNFTLFSHPLIPHMNEKTVSIQIQSPECESYQLTFSLVTQNDFIDHNRKANPIVPHYQRNDFTFKNEKKFLTFNYQYIKYESDDGFIFSKKNILNGVGIYGSNEFDRNDISDSILSIRFKMNSANYDYYKRSFQKFQTFLAEVMSLINLIITISSVVSEFLLYKKMNKDIIRYILTTEKNKESNRGKELTLDGKKFHQIFEIDDKPKNVIVENNIKENKIQVEQNSKDSFNTSNKDNNLKIESMDSTIINVMKNLNFMNIMKSFFCFEDKKLKLINLCDNIVKKDICVESILKRLYILENNYNLKIEKDNNKSRLKDNLSRVKKSISKIDVELGNQTYNLE